MNMKKNGRWITLFTVFIIIVFMIITVRNTLISIELREQVEQNSQNFIYEMTNLEGGQLVYLNDITPFEWDYLYVFDLYTSFNQNQECMNYWGDGFITNVYICFFLEDALVAKIFSFGLGYHLDFRHEVILENGDIVLSPSIRATPDDNLEFSVIVEQSFDREDKRRVLQLIFE